MRNEGDFLAFVDHRRLHVFTIQGFTTPPTGSGGRAFRLLV
jgi:hypothetical protein